MQKLKLRMLNYKSTRLSCVNAAQSSGMLIVQYVKSHIHCIIMWVNSLLLSIVDRSIVNNLSFLFNHRALFIRWSRPDEKHFVIVGVPADLLQLVIEYAYNNNNSSNTITVNEKTVQDLLQAAGFLGMRSISNHCCKFLGLILCPTNCISIYQLAKKYFCIPLERKAFKFVLSNFEVAESSEEFLQLDLENLCNIIAHDGLCVSSEAVVFWSIIRWITHAIEDRREFMAILFSKVKHILSLLLL